MHNAIAAIARAALCASVAIVAAALAAPPARAGEICAPVGHWSSPGNGPVTAQDLLARAANAKVVLLGASHDSADHHRWELPTVAALAGGAETVGAVMFPMAMLTAAMFFASIYFTFRDSFEASV